MMKRMKHEEVDCTLMRGPAQQDGVSGLRMFIEYRKPARYRNKEALHFPPDFFLTSLAMCTV